MRYPELLGMPLTPVPIGETIVRGIIFDPRSRAKPSTMNFEDLLASIPRLFDLLEDRGIEYVLVGGIAMRAHVAGRNTQDIDLIVSEDALDKIPEIKVVDRKDPFVHGNFGSLEVDLLLTSYGLFDLVRSRHSERTSFVERQIPCATVEGLLLLKLFALPSLYRQERFTRVEDYEHDVAVLLRAHTPDLESAFAELTNYLSETDLAEVRDIAGSIETRIRASRDRFPKP